MLHTSVEYLLINSALITSWAHGHSDKQTRIPLVWLIDFTVILTIWSCKSQFNGWQCAKGLRSDFTDDNVLCTVWNKLNRKRKIICSQIKVHLANGLGYQLLRVDFTNQFTSEVSNYEGMCLVVMEQNINYNSSTYEAKDKIIFQNG